MLVTYSAQLQQAPLELDVRTLNYWWDCLRLILYRTDFQIACVIIPQHQTISGGPLI